jgi:hypothetical protein
MSVLAITACAVASGSDAVEVKFTHEVATTPDRVWAAVGDPGLAMLVPALVEKIEVSGIGVGAERTLHLPGGAEVKERIIARDDAAMTYTYVVIDFGPVPWLECVGTWSVTGMTNGHSMVTYSARIVPRDAATKDAVSTISELNQRAMFARLDEVFQSQGN